MKRIIAIVLALVFVLSLASCSFGGPSIKKPKEEVKAQKFYEDLRAALPVKKTDDLKKSLKMDYEIQMTGDSKTKYEGGKTVKGTGEMSESLSMEYLESLGLLHIVESETSVVNSPSEKENSESKSEDYYLQNNDKIRVFDEMEKTFYDRAFGEDTLQTVQTMVNEKVMSSAKGVLSEIVSFELLFMADEAFKAINFEELLKVDEGTEVTYYVDDGVFTVVQKITDKSDEEFKTENKYSYETTSEITVQIVIKDDKISIAMKGEMTRTEAHEKYEETSNATYTASMVLEFTDVKLDKPDAEKYIDLNKPE